jgi:hypothetical protein
MIDIVERRCIPRRKKGNFPTAQMGCAKMQYCFEIEKGEVQR